MSLRMPRLSRFRRSAANGRSPLRPLAALLLAWVVMQPGFAFEDPALAAQAQAYRGERPQRFADEAERAAPVDLRAAERDIAEQRWQAAVEAYQRAVAHNDRRRADPFRRLPAA